MKPTTKLMLTDADGILLDWSAAFQEWVWNKYKIERLHLNAYGLHDCYGIPKEVSRKYVREFNESAAMASLPPYQDAQKWVAKINQDLGIRFDCITSMSDCKYAWMARWMNLNLLFGDVFNRLITLDVGADKDEALAQYADSGLMWLEDKVENAQAGTKAGLNSVLLFSSHHTEEHINHPDFTTVASWHEIYEMAKEYYAD